MAVLAVLAVWLTPLILIYFVCEAVVELADKLPNLPRPGGWPRRPFKPGKILPKKNQQPNARGERIAPSALKPPDWLAG